MGIAEKAEHVRRAGQTRRHSCHWPGCDVQCPPAKWGCRHHWFKLPGAIRLEIWRAYRIGQEDGDAPVSERYIAAARAAQDWIAENHPEAGKAREPRRPLAGFDHDCETDIVDPREDRPPAGQGDLFG